MLNTSIVNQVLLLALESSGKKYLINPVYTVILAEKQNLVFLYLYICHAFCVFFCSCSEKLFLVTLTIALIREKVLSPALQDKLMDVSLGFNFFFNIPSGHVFLKMLKNYATGIRNS